MNQYREILEKLQEEREEKASEIAKLDQAIEAIETLAGTSLSNHRPVGTTKGTTGLPDPNMPGTWKQKVIAYLRARPGSTSKQMAEYFNTTNGNIYACGVVRNEEVISNGERPARFTVR